MTAKTINGGTPTSYSYNAANELTNTGYSFDANGNMTASPTLTTLAYDAKNHNSSVTPSGGSATSITYRGSGQPDRASFGSETFTHSKLGTAARFSGSNHTNFNRDPARSAAIERTRTA